MLIGHTLKNRYKVYERLGVGGAATVYLGRDTESGQMVVVKLVHSHLADAEFIERFRREIFLLKQIDNPHVIKLYDWRVDEVEEALQQPLNYIVTEYVEGHTLADIIDTRGPLDEPDALALARQISVGLAAIHSQGIVHRDIKSQNIMITPEDEAMLIDFGIARGQGHSTLTRSSHFAGTLYYAPPEQILEAHTVDHRADLYALGVVLYEMLTASLPIKAREMGTVASKIIAGDLDPITGVSFPVEELVNEMLATQVSDRVDSAETVIRRIDAITGGVQEAQLPARPPASMTATIRIRQVPEPTESAPQINYGLVASNKVIFRLNLPETIIGRSHPRHTAVPDVDLMRLGIDEARTVSRRHSRIYDEDGLLYVEDLGSMNGTFLNEVALEAGYPHVLKEGDVLTIGQVDLTFCQIEM